MYQLKTKHLFVALSTMLALPCYSQTNAPAAKRTPSPEDIKAYVQSRSRQGESEYYKGWTTEPWNGNNKPYAEARKELNLYKTRGTLASKLPLYRKEAKANPINALKQYRLVFAEWLLNDKNKNLVLWRNNLAIPVSPRTYDYARLRFLVTAENAMGMGRYAGDPNLRDAGVRLLRIKPDDKLTAYWVTRIRERSDSLQDKQINVEQALQQVRLKPNDANAQGALANAYQALWMQTKRRSDSVKAVDNFKKYLSMVPPNAPERKNVEFWIEDIPKSQSKWEAKGIGKRN